MKLLIKHIFACSLLAAAIHVHAVQVGVDPAKSWIGYMNVFDLPADGGAFKFGSPWGTADLNASFSGSILTLTPNTSISRDVALTDTFWWTAGGDGNKSMDANMYVQDDALAGQTVNFTGNVLAYTLVSPYTCVAFIKEFDGGYGLINSTTVPLVNGVFNITLTGTTGVHIQYGFETVGPNARNEAGQAAALGSVQVEPVAAVTNGVNASITAGTRISWTATGVNSYLPQKSANNSAWTDFGALLSGNNITSRFDTVRSPYYRVLEITPGSAGNLVLNPGFEISAANAIGAANWNIAVLPNAGADMWVTNQFGAISAHGGANFLFIESSTPATGSVAAPNTDVRSDFIPVTAGTTYDLSFYAANPVKIGGANPQYSIFFYNAANAPVGGPIFTSFASVGSAWTQVITTVTPPAGATQLTIGWIQAAGAANGEDWVTLIDDVSLSTGAASPGTTNIISAAVQPGVQISWASANGTHYQVQSAASLSAAPAWSAFGGPVSGNGNTNSVNDSVVAPQKSYRVLQLP